MGGWSELPFALSDLIAKQLDIPDLIRFGGVCTSWRTDSAPALHHKNFLPWVIFPCKEEKSTKTTIKTDQTFGFYSLSDQKHYLIQLPKISGRRICGSFAGWVVTVDEDLDIQLLQPFSRTIVPLPSFMKLPCKRKIGTHLGEEDDPFFYDTFRADYIQEWESRSLRNYYIEKVIISRDSPVVMAIFRNSRKLAFCGLGKDDKWIIIEGNFLGICRDIAYYKGQFYVINCSREVFVVEGLHVVSPLRPFVKNISAPAPIPAQAPIPVPAPAALVREEDYGSNDTYLVESAGELLMVIRFVDEDFIADGFGFRKTLRFRVFKLDSPSASKELVEVDSLGDQALFVGCNHSFSLSTSKRSKLKANCIYFVIGSGEEDSGVSFGVDDIGVFNLENGIMQPSYVSDLPLTMSAPTWFLSDFC